MRHGEASYDVEANAVVIRSLVVDNETVTREARRWTTGERGEIEDRPERLAQADLTLFVARALELGSVAMAATGTARDTLQLERLLREVGERAADSSVQAAKATGQAVKDATATVAKASKEAQQAISEVEAQSRKAFTRSVTEARVQLQAEVQRHLGGENPEVVDRLRPLLDKFGTDLDAKVSERTTELLEKVARQFDPSDPTSPMAKHAAKVAAEQERLTATLTKNHEAVTTKLDELATTVKVREARSSLAKVTPIKGGTFEDEVHALLQEIAAGLGDEYVVTVNTTGAIPRNKKGDGVLTVDGGATRVVLEMTDSPRVDWNSYLDEAERNRGAAASVGLVRTPDQNAGQSVRVLAPRRIVLAFNPATDDAQLLRTVVMLLRTAAIAAAARQGADEVATAEEKITEALQELTRIDCVKKEVASISKSAVKIDGACNGIHAAISRLLNQALVALSGAEHGGTRTEPEPTQYGAA